MMKPIWITALVMTFISPPLLADGAGEHRHEHGGGHRMAAGHGHPVGAAQAAQTAPVSRVIDVTLLDTMRFDPPAITVKAGETIRFRLKNAGAVPHEMVIGSSEALQAHAQAMRSGGGHPAAHDDSVGMMLPPGQRGDLVHTFRQAGTIDFACLVPGHFEAGMVGKIEVRQGGL